MCSHRSDDEWIDLIIMLLTSESIPEELEIDSELQSNTSFQKLMSSIVDLRDLSAALSRGNLHMFAYSKGYILSNLKALQANLRHLTWQTKQVAKGDFSQRVEFLGEFSDSFNEMAARLQQNTLELERLANVDFLTQIPNRRSAIQYLEQLFTLYKRSRREFSLLILDIDFFKHVNDTYGHDAGDKVLKEISRVAKNVFRESDVFCRLGGEEFIAILPETPLEGAVMIAERVRKTIMDRPVSLDDDGPLHCTVSVGISQIYPEDENYDSVMIRSDEALYQAKKTGRNKTCANPELDIDEIVRTSHTRFGRTRGGIAAK